MKKLLITLLAASAFGADEQLSRGGSGIFYNPDEWTTNATPTKLDGRVCIDSTLCVNLPATYSIIVTNEWTAHDPRPCWTTNGWTTRDYKGWREEFEARDGISYRFNYGDPHSGTEYALVTSNTFTTLIWHGVATNITLQVSNMCVLERKWELVKEYQYPGATNRFGYPITRKMP